MISVITKTSCLMLFRD